MDKTAPDDKSGAHLPLQDDRTYSCASRKPSSCRIRVGCRIFHDEDTARTDGGGTERRGEFRRIEREPDPRLEPLALMIEKRDSRERRLRDLRGERGEVFERPI